MAPPLSNHSLNTVRCSAVLRGEWQTRPRLPRAVEGRYDAHRRVDGRAGDGVDGEVLPEVVPRDLAQVGEVISPQFNY